MADKMAMAIGKRYVAKKFGGKQDNSNTAKSGNSAKNTKKGKKIDVYRWSNPSKGGKMKIKHEDYFMMHGVPEKDAIRAAQILKWARRLDGYRFGRWRFGPGTAIGLFIPGVGPTIDSALALMLVISAGRISKGSKGHGLDNLTKGKMLANVGLGYAIGLTPVLGEIGDSLYQPNTKNAMLLEQMLFERVKVGKYADWEADKSGTGPARKHAPTNGSHAPINGHHKSASAPIEPSKDDPRHHNVHQRLQATAARDRAKTTQAPRSGTGWFGKSKRQGANMKGGEEVPARPSRSNERFSVGDIAGDDHPPPQLPPRQRNTRQASGGFF